MSGYLTISAAAIALLLVLPGEALEKIEESNKPECSAKEDKLVARCLEPLLVYATEIQSNGVQFPLEGGNIFERLCALYLNFDICTQAIKCSSVSTKAIEASYGYMCGDGYAKFRRHIDCFALVESHSSYIRCKERASGEMEKLKTQMGPSAAHGWPADAQRYFASLCETMSSYLSCSRPIILNECGDEAWQLIKRVTQDSMMVTMPKCDLGPALNMDG